MTAGQHIAAFFMFQNQLCVRSAWIEYMTEHATIMLCDKEKKYQLKMYRVLYLQIHDTILQKSSQFF